MGIEDPNDPHYMTKGAREQFQRYRKYNILGYIFLAIAMTVGMWTLTNRIDEKIRKDLNNVAVQSCLGSIPTLTKYNDLVEVLIQSNRDARELNVERGDLERSKLNTQNIIRLQKDKLPVPTERQCERTILLPE